MTQSKISKIQVRSPRPTHIHLTVHGTMRLRTANRSFRAQQHSHHVISHRDAKLQILMQRCAALLCEQHHSKGAVPLAPHNSTLWSGKSWVWRKLSHGKYFEVWNLRWPGSLLCILRPPTYTRPDIRRCCIATRLWAGGVFPWLSLASASWFLKRCTFTTKIVKHTSEVQFQNKISQIHLSQIWKAYQSNSRVFICVTIGHTRPHCCLPPRSCLAFYREDILFLRSISANTYGWS